MTVLETRTKPGLRVSAPRVLSPVTAGPDN